MLRDGWASRRCDRRERSVHTDLDRSEEEQRVVVFAVLREASRRACVDVREEAMRSMLKRPLHGSSDNGTDLLQSDGQRCYVGG